MRRYFLGLWLAIRGYPFLENEQAFESLHLSGEILRRDVEAQRDTFARDYADLMAVHAEKVAKLQAELDVAVTGRNLSRAAYRDLRSALGRFAADPEGYPAP
jgi:hypothetical protein